MRGSINIERGLIDHPIVGILDHRGKPNHKRFSAWIWLIMQARWKNSEVFINGKMTIIKRGQFLTALSFISKGTGLSIKEVRNLLKVLEQHGLLGTAKGTGQTLITICNYETYQLSNDGQGTTKGTRRAHEGHAKGTPGATNRRPDVIPDEIPDVISVKANTTEIEYQYLEWKGIFPKTGNDKRSREEFTQAIERISFDTLKEKTSAYAGSVIDQEQRYIKSPHNWLKDDCWNDPLREPEGQEEDIVDKYFSNKERLNNHVD